MLTHLRRAVPALLLCALPAFAQDTPPARVPAPAGVEVQARGPVHEAFASPTTDPLPTKPVPKKPPAPIEELPPSEKPEGASVWIGGYWAWDDDSSDFMWVSGVWRTVPPGKTWVAGYWRADGDNHRWVPGFWTTARAEKEDFTYLPSPPEPPRVADPGKPPSAESFYVPGVWAWAGTSYRWRAGYWGRVHPGHVWVADHYRWAPSGYVHVAGYWDLAISRRGVLYAPVFISPRVRVAGFVYTPSYAVRDTVIVEAMFVRPAMCHYYFGDYYGPRYVGLGFTSAVVYSRRRYEPIIAYEVYARRSTPAWLSVQVNLYNDRCAGRAPLPPRTLVAQTTIIRSKPGVTSITTIAPARAVVVARGSKVVAVSATERRAAVTYATKVNVAAAGRVKVEVSPRPGAPRAARTSSLTVVATPRPPAAARIERPRVPPPPPRPPASRDRRRDDRDRDRRSPR